jgi:phosphate transport system substrate-binding protein
MARLIAWWMALLVAPAAAGQELVSVQGSSTMFPIVDAAAQEYSAATARKVRVDVAVSGTSGGFVALCDKRADIATASRPILPEEAAACRRAGVRFVELPIALDALSVVVHPANGFVASLDLEQLRRAWDVAHQGSRVRWSDLDPAWPAREINLYAPDAKSGTADYFSEALFGRRDGGRSDASVSDSDFTLSQRVARDPDALGYFGVAYVVAAAGRVRAVPIVPGEGGDPVAPSADTVRSGAYQPFTRPLLVYINLRSLRREAVSDYADFLLARAPRIVPEFGYIALSEDGYAAVVRRLERRVAGTALAGLEPGQFRLDLIEAAEGVR